MKIHFLVGLVGILVFSNCSSEPKIKQQDYAQLYDTRTYEYEFAPVWRGIEEVFRKHVVLKRDPKNVTEVELNQLRERELESDWIYAQSKHKYIEYAVNGSPRKKYLQIRYKLKLKAKSVMGGVEVSVQGEEEVEKLDSNGKPAGYITSDQADPERARDILEKIQMAILGASP